MTGLMIQRDLTLTHGILDYLAFFILRMFYNDLRFYFSINTAFGQVKLSILQPMGRRWDRHTPLPPVAPRSA